MDNYDQLAQKVDSAQGVLTVTMGTLRDTHGMDRLGVHVARNIGIELNNRGLGHFPDELPLSQHEQVRVYRKSTTAGKAIIAAFSLGKKHDEMLRSLDDVGSQAILDKVRELVCE